VRVGDEVFILDCGTGMRDLGNALMGEGGPVEATVLISRYEWDHLQGFPFFVPAFIPGNQLTVLGAPGNGGGVRQYLEHQMAYPCFPVKLSDLGADIDYQDFEADEELAGEDVLVTGLHTVQGELSGFCFKVGRKKLAYLSGPPRTVEDRQQIARLIEGAVLIYGLPRVEDEATEGVRDWQDAVDLAEAARCKQLILFSFQPEDEDEDVARMEQRFRRRHKNVLAAFEGMSLDL
jgi:phosphoribosyl 1,2-cyclic phosphodiesterase